MMNYSVQEGPETANITFRGELTVRSAGEIREILRKTLDGCRAVTVRLEDIEILDLSCIQIFCAAQKTAFKMNKQLALDTVLPEAVVRTIEQAGFYCLKTCGNNKNNACPMTRRTDG
ncbi:MAG: STAS domain-containing protein [Syntrophorhabdaceae bacterium]|nr:STAS domain-containing protein [Syntrophorhabdaceae bacterium]MDD5244900.1 STAS domain-containing protein [Syntrophorhabdaceae bacterium]